ncbi:hypothetical protein BKA93DRAFT_371186 [Sparassis latifolia]
MDGDARFKQFLNALWTTYGDLSICDRRHLCDHYPLGIPAPLQKLALTIESFVCDELEHNEPSLDDELPPYSELDRDELVLLPASHEPTRGQFAPADESPQYELICNDPPTYSDHLAISGHARDITVDHAHSTSSRKDGLLSSRRAGPPRKLTDISLRSPPDTACFASSSGVERWLQASSLDIPHIAPPTFHRRRALHRCAGGSLPRTKYHRGFRTA